MEVHNMMDVQERARDLVLAEMEISECPMSKMVLAMNGGVCHHQGSEHKQELDRIKEMSESN